MDIGKIVREVELPEEAPLAVPDPSTAPAEEPALQPAGPTRS